MEQTPLPVKKDNPKEEQDAYDAEHHMSHEDYLKAHFN
jgi:hypothetical protein